MFHFLSIFKNFDMFFHCELLLRIILAGFCGFIIGIERKNRGKGAGVRTHTIVAMASCLLMIISQYGFNDFMQRFADLGIETKIDPSRIAAQIVSGIGFLGAGMIFVHRHSITGLTTAAGIWATSGIGMSIGSGMYFISIATTLVIVCVQIFLHNKKIKFLHPPTELDLTITLTDNESVIAYIVELLSKHNITVSALDFKRNPKDETITIDLTATSSYDIDNVELVRILDEETQILSVKM